jgi:hypothetical protein
MAVSLGETGITYNDGSVQTTKLDGATDTGQLMSISSYTAARIIYMVEASRLH